MFLCCCAGIRSISERKCYIQGVRPSERPFVGLHTNPINLFSVPLFFSYGIRIRLYRCADWIRKGERDKRLVSLCSARRRWPCVLLLHWPPRCSCSAVYSAVDGDPALLLPLLHRAALLLPAAPSTLRHALPDGVGTAEPTCGDHPLGRLLATEGAVQGEVLGLGTEALQPCLLLQLRCPDAYYGGGCSEIRCML
jgi:hypothetical protein